VREWLSPGGERPPWEEVVGESSTLKTYWTAFERLKVVEGVVYRSWYNHEGLTTKWQVVLPESMHRECMEVAHQGRTGGHLGPDRTAKQVQRRAYWVAWGKDVKAFVRACSQCACYSRAEAPRQGYMQAAPVGEPWERVAIDITGPHPASKTGNRYILTVLDHFSKWTEAFPIRNHEAVTVAKILADQVFARFGIPLQLLSDRGQEFESSLMKELCAALGIEKLRTTAYKPSTNGALERFHRTLNSMLAKVVDDNQRDWDDHLQSVMAAYRASPHDSTGFTPNFVLLGRECRAPLDLLVGPPPSEEERWGSIDAFVYRQQQIKREAYAAVRLHLGTAAERSKDRYDLRVRPAKFAVGDWIFLYCPRRRPGRNVKWAKFYSGPLLVVKVLGPVNYLVQKSSKAKAQVVHVDKMKRVEGETPRSWLVQAAVESSAVGSTLDEIQDVNSDGSNAVIAAPATPSRVGGGLTDRVGDGEQGDEGVTTRADTPNGPPPSVVVPTRLPATDAVPVRVQPKRQAGMPKRYLLGFFADDLSGPDVARP
jgi:transposase InsO family protein